MAVKGGKLGGLQKRSLRDLLFACGPDNDMGTRIIGGVEPGIERTGDPKGQVVVILRTFADQDLKTSDETNSRA